MAPLSLTGIEASYWPSLKTGESFAEAESVLACHEDLETLPLDRIGELYVEIPGDADVECLRPVLSKLKGVGIIFPAFNDGRGFTAAVRLRRDLEFTGEVRALGPVIPDQAQFLMRSGFDSVEVGDNRRAAFKVALDRFRHVYQSDVRGRRGAGFERMAGASDVDTAPTGQAGRRGQV